MDFLDSLAVFGQLKFEYEHNSANQRVGYFGMLPGNCASLSKRCSLLQTTGCFHLMPNIYVLGGGISEMPEW